jgi:hypothetical protein
MYVIVVVVDFHNTFIEKTMTTIYNAFSQVVFKNISLQGY